MIICQNCDKVSNKNQKTYLAILKEREKTYTKYILIKNHKKEVLLDTPYSMIEALKKDGYKLLKKFEYKGTEIVSVKRICKNCVQKFKKVL